MKKGAQPPGFSLEHLWEPWTRERAIPGLRGVPASAPVSMNTNECRGNRERKVNDSSTFFSFWNSRCEFEGVM